MLYRVAGDGSHPPRLQPQAHNTDKSRADFAATSAKPLLLSEVEESLKCVFGNPRLHRECMKGLCGVCLQQA